MAGIKVIGSFTEWGDVEEYDYPVNEIPIEKYGEHVILEDTEVIE
jgi:hypothetical protein